MTLRPSLLMVAIALFLVVLAGAQQPSAAPRQSAAAAAGRAAQPSRLAPLPQTEALGGQPAQAAALSAKSPSTSHHVSTWKKVVLGAVVAGIITAVIIGFTHKPRMGCFPANCESQ